MVCILTAWLHTLSASEVFPPEQNVKWSRNQALQIGQQIQQSLGYKPKERIERYVDNVCKNTNSDSVIYHRAWKAEPPLNGKDMKNMNLK